MKILAVSDSHGNIVRLKHVLGFVKNSRAWAVVHCGDWGTVEAARAVGYIKVPVYAVLGNADEARARQIEKVLEEVGVSLGVDTLEVELGGKKTVVAHQPGKVAGIIESGEYDIVFHGHTHQRKDKWYGKTHVINPGALSNTKKPSFAVYDTVSDKVEFIDLQI